MRSTIALLLVTLITGPVAAQARLGSVERRPKLASDADTNDANAYFAHASRLLKEKPGEAAQAFYWAARLDPSSAEALDGRRVAMMMRRFPLLRMYMEGGRSARQSKDLKSLDSLAMRALRINPLYYRKYDFAALMGYYRTLMRDAYPTASEGDIERAIRDYLAEGSHYMRGWMAYSEGRLPDALTEYTAAMKNVRDKGFLILERARVLALQGLLPAAVEEFRLAALELGKAEADRDEYVVFYNSKALVEHSRGVLYARMNNLDSAKAALGRAITEDLSYFMAHVELGRLALAAKDTVTAVSELALAADLASDEPFVHYLYGSTLLSAGQAAGASESFKKALELEPLHAASHFELAQALDRMGDKDGAREGYKRYLALAARRDVQRRALAAERIAGLQP